LSQLGPLCVFNVNWKKSWWTSHLFQFTDKLYILKHFTNNVYLSILKKIIKHTKSIPSNSYQPITIRRGFAPGFVYYKKGCTRLVATSHKVYQLLAHGRWFSPGTPASSTTKTGRHDIAEILLKVALNTKNQSIINKYT
jgi:hypothetical protein